MKYLTFPIIILNPGPAHIKDVLSNAMDYCLYCEYLKQEGSHLERSKLAAKELGLRFSGLESAVKNGRCLFDSIPEGSPKTSIDKDRIFDFYKQGRDEFEIVCFLAYAALRSIIQKQSCKKVTNDYLLSRMAGNSKKDEALPEWLKKYQKEYWLNKIKDELQISHWGCLGRLQCCYNPGIVTAQRFFNAYLYFLVRGCSTLCICPFFTSIKGLLQG